MAELLLTLSTNVLIPRFTRPARLVQFRRSRRRPPSLILGCRVAKHMSITATRQIADFALRRCLTIVLLSGLLSGVLIPSTALSQTIQLTPQQQLMLDQLPAEQRQQALRLLRQAQNQGAGGESPSTLVEELSTSDDPAAAALQEILRESAELRAEVGSRLVIDFSVSPELDRQESALLSGDPALQGLVGSRYFELDSTGTLELPGVTAVPVLGLTADEIETRLAAETDLRVFTTSVTILQSAPTGTAALEPFGYDFFEASTYGFDPVTSGPVPPDYVLGPGDSVRVQLFGNVSGIYEYEVTRDGILTIPELGPVTVVGLSFSELRNDLNRRVQEMLIGTQVSVTMGQLRTIRVFVLGDANRPGSYVVSSLATISTALYASGGVSRVGSLRAIQLKRNGDTVAELDLYDLLLRGDTSGDRRLMPGDAIFIPPVGSQVSVSGAVKRPAIYELERGATIRSVVQLAGGLLADAFAAGTRIERVDSDQGRVVLSVDLNADEGRSGDAMPGDIVVVPRVLPQLEMTVTLEGHVYRPGPYQWRSGMRLSDLIGSRAALQPNADSEYILIRREDGSTGRIQALSANLIEALANPVSANDPELRPRDTITVFDLEFGRQRVVAPLLEELELQSGFGRPNPIVSVSGQVRAPGPYPLEAGMRVSDLIRAGGGLAEEAYALRAEVVRYEIVDNEYRRTEIMDVNLASAMRGDSSADISLAEHDDLRISGLPQWDTQWSVTLDGEVKFPGIYRIRRGESLAEILERAGGLTDAAFPEGAVFLRESLRIREQEQIETLAQRLEADITSMSLETLDTTGSEALTTGRELLTQLRSTEAVGRLVIDLVQIAQGADVAVELRDGDRLLVPKQAQEVTVIGETQQNTSHLFMPGLTRADYIEMSGGLTRRADKRLIYVVRANGAVVTGGRSRWFGRAAGTDIRPGDTIVVPLETDRVRPLTFWTGVTQILYQAAIAVAAIETFND